MNGANFCYIHKNRLFGLVVFTGLSRRMHNNMRELELNTAEKKLFDPVKAKAQLEVYKEIYKIEKEEDIARDQGRELTDEEKERIKDENDGALRILKSASGKDISEIGEFFERRESN